MNIVYILTNEAMPGYIKIGKTKSQLIKRIKALDTTGVPLSFECFYAAEVADCDAAERLLHDAFADRRVRKNREFFTVSPERVASALKLAAISEVTPNDVFETKDDAAAVESAKTRRPPFNFRYVALPAGTVLYNSKDEDITCKIHDSKSVEFRGELTSLSQAALTVVNEMGYNWKNISGPEAWCYDGETLDARRQRLDAEE